jgi:adenylate kinase
VNILLFGVQASGKGTQADLLAKKFSIPHISTGELFRDIDKNSELGKIVYPYINRGDLVPDQFVLQIVTDRLKKDDAQNGFVLEGFPRHIGQAKQLDQMVHIDCAVVIKISDRESLQRILGRRVCSNKTCDSTYNVYTMPKPKTDGICDKCGSPLILREDETEDAVQKRISIYHNETEPVLDFYREKEILIEINGENTIEDVQKELLSKLNKFFNK